MDITIPELGESITEGTISAWIKNEGDPVKFGDILLELETDKVNMEVTATADGVLDKITKQTGETVLVGESVGTIEEEAGESKAEKPQKDVGETDEPDAANEANYKDDEHNVASSQQTDQHTDSSAEKTSDRDESESTASSAPSASPSVRRLAREKRIDLNQIKTANPLGRISRADIRDETADNASGKTEESASDTQSRKSASDQNVSNAAEQASKGQEETIERIRMSRRRQTIAKHLLEAQHNAAMLTTFNEVDMTAILDLRKRRKESFMEKHEVGLGFMSFFTKAVIGALKAFPMLNAEIDGDEIVLKKFYDIGIAVSAKEGLVVPVVREADRKSFAQIEKNIGELANKAKSNTLELSDLQGGTFTITNGGVFGSLLSTPILNTPQVGILGMHTIQKRPVAIDDDKMENRPMMYIALSYDHRIVDGSEAVRFLVTVKELLEDPESLLLEG